MSIKKELILTRSKNVAESAIKTKADLDQPSLKTKKDSERPSLKMKKDSAQASLKFKKDSDQPSLKVKKVIELPSLKVKISLPVVDPPVVPRKRGRPRKIRDEPLTIKKEKLEEDETTLTGFDSVDWTNASDDDTRDNDWTEPTKPKQAIGRGRTKFSLVSAASKKKALLNNIRKAPRIIPKKTPLKVVKVANKKKPEDVHVTCRRISSARQKMLRKEQRALSDRLILTLGIDHRCGVCDAGFAFHAGLAAHQRTRHAILRKDLATFRLSQRCANAARHQRTSGVNGSAMACVKCGMAFLSRSRFLAHNMSHAKKRNKNAAMTYRPVGLRLFTTWVRLLRQERVRNLTTNPRKSVGAGVSGMGASIFSNRCGWCGTSYVSRLELLEHRRTVHAPKPKLAVVTNVGDSPRVKRTHLDWTCKERGCPVPQCKNKEALKLHMSVMHAHIVISCPGCRFKTQLEYFLKRCTY